MKQFSDVPFYIQMAQYKIAWFTTCVALAYALDWEVGTLLLLHARPAIVQRFFYSGRADPVWFLPRLDLVYLVGHYQLYDQRLVYDVPIAKSRFCS